jgi:hypothetical protein
VPEREEMIPFSPEKDLRRWLAAMERAADRAADPSTFTARDPDVSDWRVGMHLEHVLRADRGIVDWLASTAAGTAHPPDDPARGSPSWRGWLVLWTGYIPRGAGRAPGPTVPEGMEREAVARGLRDVLTSARELRGELDALARSNARLEHPVLGSMGPLQWLRFGRIHHDHHRKIVRDVLRSGEEP